MKVNDKIRLLREEHRWSQEMVAEKLNISQNAYACIERGETKLHLERLEQIAEVFGKDIIELMFYGENKSIQYMCNIDNSQGTQYGENSSLTHEISRLNLVIQHQQDLLKEKEQQLLQKDNEILALKEVIELLKKS